MKKPAAAVSRIKQAATNASAVNSLMGRNKSPKNAAADKNTANRVGGATSALGSGLKKPTSTSNSFIKSESQSTSSTP